MPRKIVERIFVWDRFVRWHHWSLIGLLAVDGFVLDGSDAPHHWVGYAAAGLVGARLVWGVIGPSSARFVSFFPTPARIRAYVRTLRQPMRGHNPIGAIMIMLLLTLVLALGVTGWLLGTDAYWGDETLETLHEALAYGLLGCAFIHVAGVLLVSWRTRVNLLRAMLTGYKVRHNDALPFRD